jgi:NTP pyrophosphatase (non-canonical NTP hydrolase)
MSDWQEAAVTFAQKHNYRHAPGVHIIDLLSELGEVAKAMLTASAYGEGAFRPNPAIADEMGDLLYAMCLLADAVDVDLDSALRQTLIKYETRWQETGHIANPTSQLQE